MTEMKDYFDGAEQYYRKYRPFYPNELISDLVFDFNLSEKSKVLDLGSATGQSAISISPFVGSVVAVEPNGEMISEGKKLAMEKESSNIKWIQGTAEDVDELLVEDNFTLAVFGASFHWMDQSLVLDILDSHISTKGGIAVMGSKSVWRPTEMWEETVKDIIQSHLGKQRRAGTGAFLTSAKTDKPFKEIINESNFSVFNERRYFVKSRHTVKEVIGRILSTSFANPSVLGDKQSVFEKDVSSRLLKINPDDVFEKEDEYYLITGMRSIIV
jgi:SAM-dependent methyltransferase